MPLLIDVKPGERVYVGSAIITNRGKYRTRLEFEGSQAVLRETELLRQADLDSPCKHFYFTIQTMYLSGNAMLLQETYLAQTRAIQQAEMKTEPFLKTINEAIQAGQYHKALKEARRLIELERLP